MKLSDFFIKTVACFLLAFGSFRTQAVSIPGALSPDDITRITEKLVLVSIPRPLRSAENYEAWPGFRLGVEALLIFPGSLGDLGNRSGSVPSVLATPRLLLTKSLGEMVEATVYFFPGSLDPTFGEWGLSIKGLGISEKEEWGSVAGYLSFGHVSGFNHTFQGNAFELGVVASKDWVRVRPYVGAALLAGTGEVSQSLALAENDTSLLMRFHGFLGTEVIVPADLAFQLDWFGFGWGASTFVGYRF